VENPPQISPAGKIYYVAFLIDSEQSMVTSTQMGSFALNPNTGELTLSQEAYPIFGFDSCGDPPTCPMVVARMHPDDRDEVEKSAERAFRDATGLEGEYRILLPGGGMRHVHYLAHRVVQASGRRTEYVGTLLDVTSQRAVQAELDAMLSEARALAAKLMLTVRHSEELTRRVVKTQRFRATNLAASFSADGERYISGETSPARITPRERQIVELVAEARSTKQIAFQLGIGAKTVEAHRTHIMKKLGLHSASELVRYAITNGIVEVQLPAVSQPSVSPLDT
jgi:DNA-binding NarL/FixJ family response regulator